MSLGVVLGRESFIIVKKGCDKDEWSVEVTQSAEEE